MLRKSVLVAAVAATLIVPGSASAAVTCTFAGDTVDIDATGTSSFVKVERGTGGQANDIRVLDGSTPVSCGATPTVTTADTVDFNSSAATSGATLYIDLTNGAFAPGLTDETGASDEIEFTLTGGAGNDQLSLGGTPAGDTFRLGAAGAGVAAANLNGAEIDGVDVDVTATLNNRVFADGIGGGDTITADGTGGGFTGPLAVEVSLLGGGADDTLVSGNGGNNSLDGGPGDDTMTGGPNTDSIDLDEGNDVGDGAGGIDAASYLNWTPGVTVDLRITGPQNTGGGGTDTLSNFEDLVGSNAADTLIGTDAQNTIVGGQLSNDGGADTLIGNGGPDLLNGGPGGDTLIGGQGNDSLIGAEGTDTASYATGSTGAVTLSLDLANTGVAQDTGGAGVDTLTDSFVDAGSDHDVENLTGSPFAGDTLTGNGMANVIDSYGDGLDDTVDCVASGDGDTAVLDEATVEAVSNCETSDNAPQTTVDSGPANGATIADATPTYNVLADEPSSIELSVDGGAFNPCGLICSPPALADGEHELAFRAVDDDENEHADPTAATRTVTVDTAAPAVTIDSAPPASSADTTPSWSFSSDDAAAVYECRVDGGPFAGCSGTGEHTATVADGAHTFEVRATDAVGNSAVATDEFAVDAKAPETALGKVKKRTTKRKVKLSFSSDDAGASFECSLDGKAFAACASPLKTKKLKPGKHRFEVRAVDAAGNADATPAVAKFRVVKRKR
jgi:Ca2+-binding RTX toxin-like protein